MTTLRVLLHVAAQRDYELHSLDFSTAFLQGSLHEEIWLRRPPGFTGSFPAGTQWSLWRPVYGLRQAPREWHDTLRTTLAALGFAPSTADPSLFLRTDATLPPFYVLVYVDDLVFATADTEALAHMKSELQKRHTCTDLGELTSYLGLRITRDRAQRTITLTQSHMVQQVLQRFDFTYSSPQSTPLPTGHSLSAPPSDESVEPSGPYPELVGCLMYLMTCTRPDLAYPLSLLARYVAPGRHRKVHWDAAKRVLRYLCSTSGMWLVLGGRARVVLIGHADTSWVDDLATQRSSQGYTFSLSSGSVSWRSTRSSSVLSSSCEAEIYAGAMAAQELRWLTYLLTDLGEAPRSPPVLYANTADVFTKALQPSDHQPCFAFLDWSCDLLFSPTLPMGPARCALLLRASRPAAACTSRPAALRVAPCCNQRVAPYCPACRALLQPASRALLQPARRALLPSASRPAAASASRPTPASTLRPAALRVTPCCSQRAHPTAASASRPAALRVAPCCSQRVALCFPARRALLQPARRALLPLVSCPAALHSTCPAALSTTHPALQPAVRPARPSHAAQPKPPYLDHQPHRAALLTPLLLLVPLLLVVEVLLVVLRVLQVLGVLEVRLGVLEVLLVPEVRLGVLEVLLVPEAAALGASEFATALGASESAAALGAIEFAADLGAHASPATGLSSAEALHTFTLDSGVSRCFFRDCTTLTPLAAPVPVSLADPTGGPVVVQASIVLLCPAVSSGSLSGLHLPTFSTNLVSNAAI
ncbi:unnamed protein product [Closterium sp. NIES-53]